MLKHPFKVSHDVGVGEADDAPALFLKEFGPAGVVFCLSGVGVAVNFHHQHRGAASKVGDVRADHSLPAEFPVVEAVGAEVVP